MATLYTRVSDDFDPEQLSGVLVCCEDPNDTYGFTEKGYDTADYDAVPTVYEVAPTVARFAGSEEAIQAARAAGIKIFDTHDDIDRARAAGSFSGSWQAGDCICLEESSINGLVEDAAFRAALEAAGIVAIRDYVVVGNEQPMMTILWRPETANLSGPIAIEPRSDDDLHVVRISSPKSNNAPRP